MATLVKANLLEVFKRSQGGWLPLCNYLTEEYGRSVDLAMPFRKTVYLSDPAVIHDLFVGQHTKTARSQIHQVIGKVLGVGLITSEGDLWKRQRRLLQPLFTKKSVREYEPTMVRIAKEVIGGWHDTTGKEPLRMDQLTFDYAVRIILECVLGKPTQADWRHISDLLNLLGEYLEQYIAKPFLLPFWVPVPLNVKINSKSKELTDCIQAVIDELAIAERDENGANLVRFMKDHPEQTAQQILDEVRTVFIAGHETSASTLAWACVLLSQHPEFQEELAAEIRSLDEDPEGDALKSPLLLQFALETLRLFPSGWSFTRKCSEDIHTHGIVLPKGATLVIDLFNSHRDPEHFENPSEFNPRRFGIKAKERPQFYMPFGAGPRTCVGNNLAIEENKVFIAELLRHYRVSLDASYQHSILGRTTLRPEFGVPLHLESRA